MGANKKLIDFRKSIGKTQDEMAEILRISTSYYMKIENGQRNPSYNFIKQMKNMFNLDINEIFFKK